MPFTNPHFHQEILDCVVGGLSAVDLPRLEIESLDEAHQFLLTYGFDLKNSSDLEKAWSFHRRAVTLVRENFLDEGEAIPETLADPAQLQDVAKLLVYASSRAAEHRELQLWSCTLLRVMHVFAHIESDLFAEFAEEIQMQVLKSFRDHLLDDPAHGPVLGTRSEGDKIYLSRFDVKPFKTTTSSVIKLLTKPQSVALTLMDKMGVRFVTKNVFDSFRVIRFLVDEHIVSFPNIMPDQSRNTLYPINLLLEVMKEIPKDISPENLEKALTEKLEEASHRASFLEKKNEFSSSAYRAIKFVARHLIRIDVGPRKARFFFPYEVQIMDYDTFLKNLSGGASHTEYKKRQRAAARARVMGIKSRE